MGKNILITGGAGFIGSHLADELIEQGYRVRALDNLSEQVHGSNPQRPNYLHPKVDLIIGDVRNKRDVEKALEGIDSVFHFASMVGVGQSMYEITKYTGVNNLGTAVLLEALIKRPVEKLIVASSMSIYGEGMYQNDHGKPIAGTLRKVDQLKNGQWELHDEADDRLSPIPTPESKNPELASIYALSKYDQERMCLIAGAAYQIPTTAMRFFNVYGTRQALSNPYTGVLAIFASRYLNDKAPLIFEDGEQMRDFVSVHDVARACRQALESPRSNGEVFNIGSGQHYTVSQVATALANVLNKPELAPEITHKYRAGDIRHCFADISKAKNLLGYYPQVGLEDGLAELSEWLRDQMAIDRVDQAQTELAERGLAVSATTKYF